MYKRKVLCPGCGKEMKCNKPHLYVGCTKESLRYICGYTCANYNCGWIAPIGNGNTPEEASQNAYDKVIRRVSDENAGGD